MNQAKGKPLTLELVFNKTKSDNLNNIKNLNLWGNELEDLSLIDRMPNLEVISLSVNKINSLKDFANCSKLHELYLRKNCISDLSEIKYLIQLPYLKSLWLYDNPCAQQENYRQIVIHHLPNLTKLDNTMVTQEEKTIAANSKYEIDFGAPQQVKESGYYQQPPEIAKRSDVQSQSRKQRPFSQIHQQEPRTSNQPASWKAGSNKEMPRHSSYEPNEEHLNRNKNILIAVLSLMKELDPGSLQIIRKEAQKQIRNR